MPEKPNRLGYLVGIALGLAIAAFSVATDLSGGAVAVLTGAAIALLLLWRLPQARYDRRQTNVFRNCRTYENA